MSALQTTHIAPTNEVCFAYHKSDSHLTVLLSAIFSNVWMIDPITGKKASSHVLGESRDNTEANNGDKMGSSSRLNQRSSESGGDEDQIVESADNDGETS
jgi:hypothetical protein